MASSSAPNQNVVRLKPFQFIHVLDQNTNLTRVLTGPLTYTRPEHEQVVAGPDRMIIIPARHYCRIANPVIRNSEGEVELDAHSNYKLKHGDIEIRFDSEPFPLYPGEQLIGVVEPLKMIEANNALLVRATRDHQVESQTILAGQERLVRGPGTYIPTVNEEVLRPVRATIIRQNQAIRLRALRGMTDREGNARHAGEEWLYHSAGAYIPDVTEEIVRVVDALILTDKKALHVMARRNFESFGVQRRAGESWLITSRHCEAYTPNVNEEIVGEVAITTLTNRQYCVIINPIDEKGVPQLGQRKLIVGEAAFFLHPGEAIEGGAPQNIHVLGEEEALILRARSSYNDDGVVRPPGSRWMVRGPCDYIPDVEVEILDMRRCIPLDESEGIYVRDLNSGEVRMVHGESYLLGPHEVLWEKELPPIVETLLKQGAVREGTGQKKDQYGTERSKTRVVTYRAPHNSAVQVYDYKAKCSRVIFGPELVMLGPDEHFTVLSLSGGNPKVSNQQPTLSLLLGPDFMQDQIIVETSDHAQLRLQLAYNWQFELDKENPLESAKIFSVPDFVGDCCKAVAGRVRGAVALVTFEVFHKSASDIIERAVFGENANRLIFPANNLVLTNIDIQEVEPVDQKTRESLQRSVQLTIEITTKSQEAIARRDAERKEQIARGQLDRQTIQAEAESERARKSLIELKAKSLQAEHAGQAKAEAKARAAAEAIKWTAEVKTAELEAETISIRAASELEEQKQRHESELTHQAALNAMEVDRARRLAQIEAEKFAEIVSAIGPETIKSIARAGPEMQAKLLKGLGLKSFVITDGHSPVNLLGSAMGLLGAQSSV